MFIETIKSPGLAQLSYLLGDSSAGECVVIDARRDVQTYIERARARECRIVAALDTHIHADFVSGARELGQRLGCTVYGGRSDEYGYPLKQVGDGDGLDIGQQHIDCIHTPGHSPEHVCYLVRGGEGAEAPWGIFTGDTLFAGSVGRPDLAAGMNSEELAGQLHDSIFNKLLPLGKGIIVYPGHGSGSPCGGSIGDRDSTTLGYEAEHNEKLQADSREDFIQRVLEDLPAEPDYYARLKKLNAEGAALFGHAPEPEPLGAEDFGEKAKVGGAFLLDIREVAAFGSAHIPGAVNLALRASFPPWAGRILPPDRKIHIVAAEPEDVVEARDHLFRMGFDNFAGYLAGGMRKWIQSGREIAQVGMVSVHELKRMLDDGGDSEVQVLDVRTPAEYESGHIPGAVPIFAADLTGHLDELDPKHRTIVYCGSDFRADLATSLLKKDGFHDVHTVLGSVSAWKQAGYPMTG